MKSLISRILRSGARISLADIHALYQLPASVIADWFFGEKARQKAETEFRAHLLSAIYLASGRQVNPDDIYTDATTLDKKLEKLFGISQK